MVDIFLPLVDRDGVETRRLTLTGLESRAQAGLVADRLLLARTPGRRSRSGHWPGKICPEIGNGQWFARKSIPRKRTFFRWFRNGTC